MGFIRAFVGALNGVLTDQQLDFLTVPHDINSTATLFPAVHGGRNTGYGSDTRDSENIISSGSKIVIPDGYDLISSQNGQIAGFVTEPDGFEFRDQDPSSQSVFAGDGVFGQVTRSIWERIKFGGRSGAMQQVFFVNLKEPSDSCFDTWSEIYWGGAYLSAQVGVVAHDVYTLRVVNPLLFISNVIPGVVIADNQVFNFDDIDNPVNEQLSIEAVACLGIAFSKYANDFKWGSRITRL